MLKPSIGNGSNRVGSNGVNHVLELLSLNASHLLGFDDFQIILLMDELCLCLLGSSQSLKLRFLTTVQYIAQHHSTRTIDLGNDEGILLTLMLLGGFYVKNLVFWIRWVEYLSFITYSYDTTLYFEFTPDNYFMYVMLDLLYLTYKVYTWPYQITV